NLRICRLAAQHVLRTCLRAGSAVPTWLERTWIYPRTPRRDSSRLKPMRGLIAPNPEGSQTHRCRQTAIALRILERRVGSPFRPLLVESADSWRSGSARISSRQDLFPAANRRSAVAVHLVQKRDVM